MKKIINPCTCEVYGASGKTRWVNAFAKIEWDGKRLNIHGVVGPMSNGDCSGSAGQCIDSIRAGTPTESWSRKMLDKFCDIWGRWHLNDMNPCCEHQRELCWEEEARQKITLYHYRLNWAALNAKRVAEEAAVEALRRGEPFTPTADQTFFATLPYALDVYEALREELAPHYEPKKPLYAGGIGASEQRTRGRVRFDESELGILCKPCPVCGYKYGTAWRFEEVPQDVIEWLSTLPDSERYPAWV